MSTGPRFEPIKLDLLSDLPLGEGLDRIPDDGHFPIAGWSPCRTSRRSKTFKIRLDENQIVVRPLQEFCGTRLEDGARKGQGFATNHVNRGRITGIDKGKYGLSKLGIITSLFDEALERIQSVDMRLCASVEAVRFLELRKATARYAHTAALDEREGLLGKPSASHAAGDLIQGKLMTLPLF